MSKKVKVLKTFIGNPNELRDYGGKIPGYITNSDRMTDAERAAFKGKITQGTEMELPDKRADELAGVGIVVIVAEGVQENDQLEKVTEPKIAEKSTVKITGKKEGKRP